jgi:hypothetical protein
LLISELNDVLELLHAPVLQICFSCVVLGASFGNIQLFGQIVLVYLLDPEHV